MNLACFDLTPRYSFPKSAKGTAKRQRMTSRTRGSRTTTATPSRGNTPNPPAAAKSKNKGGPTSEPEWVEPVSVHSPDENLKILRSNTEYAVVTQWLAMYCPLISSMSDHSTAVRCRVMLAQYRPNACRAEAGTRSRQYNARFIRSSIDSKASPESDARPINKVRHIHLM